MNSSVPSSQSIVYNPYPDYNSDAWIKQWKGHYVPCEGLRGKATNESEDDWIRAYTGISRGLPDADVGSAAMVGLNNSVCFDRYSRLGTYGMPPDTTVRGSNGPAQPDWSRVQLGRLQDECLTRNAARFFSPAIPNKRPELLPGDFEDDMKKLRKRAPTEKSYQSFKKRTAVLIRTWDDYDYKDNDIQTVRSLVSELSLMSGGEYHVFLFVNVKDRDIDFWNDDVVYRETLERTVPAELRDIAILWSERACAELYPKIEDVSVYWQQFMPVQWFSKTHPEFEYIWNWEMDARLIGHHYHFLESMVNFSRAQPRKYLWERNARHYMPAVHRDPGFFMEESNLWVDVAKRSKGLKTVWGPDLWHPRQFPYGPHVPWSEADDEFKWGVGEEADLITLLPIWDPRETFWAYRDKLFNFPWGDGSYEERPFPHIPRRVFINTVARFSRDLLHSMHVENQAGLGMASELWPASIALQHGWKAVYAPHPIWMAQKWPMEYADMVFNAEGWGAGALPGGNIDDGRGRAFDEGKWYRGEPQGGTGPNSEGLGARWGQERDGPYSPDREHYFAGWSWYFWSDFSRVIYRRWLGWKAGFSIVTIDGSRLIDELGEAGGPEVST